MTSPFNHRIIVVPREFGLILSVGGELYNHEMTAEEQLSLATRIIQVASERLREERQNGEKVTASEKPHHKQM